MSHCGLAVIVAAYNEEEGITPTICELKETLHQPHIVVIDGNSSDRTLELAKDQGVAVICQKGKGKGNAISEGIENLCEDTGYVIFTDADYTYPSKHIKEMIAVLNQNPNVGMVLGNRFDETFKFESVKNQFYLGNRILGFIQRILNGVKLNDPFTGLRIIRFELIKNWKPKSSTFDIEAEMNQHIYQLGYEIVEVPIIYRNRLGKKKLCFKDGLVILRRIFLGTI